MADADDPSKKYDQAFFLNLAAKGKDAWNAWRRDPANEDSARDLCGHRLFRRAEGWDRFLRVRIRRRCGFFGVRVAWRRSGKDIRRFPKRIGSCLHKPGRASFAARPSVMRPTSPVRPSGPTPPLTARPSVESHLYRRGLRFWRLPSPTRPSVPRPILPARPSVIVPTS